LTDELIRRVHFDMFGEIWEWAGKYRTDSVNMGVDFHLIPEQIKLLCGDFNYWNSAKGAMAPLEIAARLQNRLTRIHPFINGNGRHTRLITDIFFHSVKHPLPKWPQIQLLSEGDLIRSRYIEAMKAADKEDYRELMAFMKEFVE
jgi:Fic-DOC domain mobile mystery protein B